MYRNVTTIVGFKFSELDKIAKISIHKALFSGVIGAVNGQAIMLANPT